MIFRRKQILEQIILNLSQKDAVICDEWPQLVFAGAGSGKTRVLTAKIAYLIKEKRIFPGQIFAATFTNKAAHEMKSRVEGFINTSCEGLWIGTFHSLCARILRREARFAGYPAHFSIYDRDDQIAVIKKVMKALELDERTIPPRRLLNSISKYKNECVPPDQLNESEAPYYQKEIIRAYAGYQKMLQQMSAMDFDDLITNTVYLFRKYREVLDRYRSQFQYVLVDEYQDTNHSQFNLIRLLGEGHGHIFVVGDDDQSIYGWRGANIENILSFEAFFPGSRVFKLEQNYRSTPGILNFANAVISVNRNRTEKKLWTDGKDSGEVSVTVYRDDRLEAEGVAEKIRLLIENGVKPVEIGILFRTNAQSRPLEDAFRKRNISYVIVGGMSFYERREIKDCLAYLRLLVNSGDNVSCERILNVPSRGIGARTREDLLSSANAAGMPLFEIIMTCDCRTIGAKAVKGIGEFRSLFQSLKEMKDDNRPPHEILVRMLTDTGYVESIQNEESVEAESRLENINELINTISIWFAENGGGTLEQFLEEVSLSTDVDTWKQSGESVNCMTLHCAKGLEFTAVFIVGIEEGLIPSRQNIEDGEKLEEECRLFYVGATRAKRILECSYAVRRWRFGSIMPADQSRFLEAVSADLYRKVDDSYFFETAAKTYIKHEKRQKHPIQERKRTGCEFNEFSQEEIQFRMGQQVVHKTYGRGKILNVSGFGPDTRLMILFNDGSRKKIMGKFANLEIV